MLVNGSKMRPMHLAAVRFDVPGFCHGGFCQLCSKAQFAGGCANSEAGPRQSMKTQGNRYNVSKKDSKLFGMQQH